MKTEFSVVYQEEIVFFYNYSIHLLFAGGGISGRQALKQGCIKLNTICMSRFHNEEALGFDPLIPRINRKIGFNSN